MLTKLDASKRFHPELTNWLEASSDIRRWDTEGHSTNLARMMSFFEEYFTKFVTNFRFHAEYSPVHDTITIDAMRMVQVILCAAQEIVELRKYINYLHTGEGSEPIESDIERVITNAEVMWNKLKEMDEEYVFNSRPTFTKE